MVPVKLDNQLTICIMKLDVLLILCTNQHKIYQGPQNKADITFLIEEIVGNTFDLTGTRVFRL